MDYFETLDFLFTQLPYYQRQGPAAYKADLSSTIAICELLGNPQEGLKCIHIAGTNGKGSVAHMVASVLQEQGYKTGLYTSPHLKDFRERIRINGEMIDQDHVTSFVQKYKDAWKEIGPSFFEITVGMAFQYFKNENVDIAVIETGLGGRLDSTNVVDPEISVITNIALDHTQFLGDTIELIAAEKGGIIKAGKPVVFGKMDPNAVKVLSQMALEKQAKVYPVEILNESLDGTDLYGDFQKENLATAHKAIDALIENGWEISHESIRIGLAKIAENTSFKGRWQLLGEQPRIIADVGHNAAGVAAAIEGLEVTKNAGLHIVLGVVEDKALNSILPLFPKRALYYFCKADIQRGLPADELQKSALEFGLKGESYSSVKRAFEAARLYAQKEDTIFIGGSFFTVAEVL